MIVLRKFLFAAVIILSASAACERNQGRRGFLHGVRIQPTVGEPWPMPQSMQTTAQRLAIHPNTFQFILNDTSQRCDLLTSAFTRYYKAIFFPETYLSYVLNSSSSFSNINDNIRQKLRDATLRKRSSKFADTQVLMSLYVNIQQPCDFWPSLESNESCNQFF